MGKSQSVVIADEDSSKKKGGIVSNKNLKSDRKTDSRKKNQRRAKSMIGEPDSPSGSSSSSSFSSSVYSSTISSHLSGDEDQEKHHIQDVFRDEDEVARMNFNNQIILERESETSSKAESKHGFARNPIPMQENNSNQNRRSMSVDVFNSGVTQQTRNTAARQ